MGMLLAAASLGAGRLGALWIHFDVFAQFTLHFAVALAAFLLGFVMPRARVLTALAVMIAGCLAIPLYAHKVSGVPRPMASIAPDETPVKLISFNSWYSNDNVDAIARVIQDEDSDLVALMEFGPNKKPILEALKSRFPHQFDCLQIAYCNLVILSKHPFAEPPQARVTWDGPPYALARFGPELGNLTLVAVHTLRFPHQRAQFTQLGHLARLVAGIPSPVVVMGDFNATPFSRQIGTFGDRTGLRRLTYLPSWPARWQLPQLAIDHVFVSPAIRVIEDQRILPNAGSDHNPITITVAIPHS